MYLLRNLNFFSHILHLKLSSSLEVVRVLLDAISVVSHGKHVIIHRSRSSHFCVCSAERAQREAQLGRGAAIERGAEEATRRGNERDMNRTRTGRRGTLTMGSRRCSGSSNRFSTSINRSSTPNSISTTPFVVTPLVQPQNESESVSASLNSSGPLPLDKLFDKD